VTEGLPAAAWGTRPLAGSWSIAECLMHLNITSERYVPLLDEALRSLRTRGLLADGTLHRGVVGYMLSRFLEPPVRLKIATAPPFKPGQIDPLHEVLERFDYLQELLVGWSARRPRARPAARRVATGARLRYNLCGVLCLTAHERRLWPTERVRGRSRALF
jgi:hypothetical protein